jgi:hypothetical protein
MIQKELTPDLETDSSFVLAFCGFHCEVNTIPAKLLNKKIELIYMTTVLAGGDDVLDEQYSSMQKAKEEIISVIEKRMTQDFGEPVVLTLKSL